MGDYTTRAYTPADLAAVTGLINDIERADGSHGGITPDLVDALITSRVPDLALGTRVVSDGDGRLVAVAWVPAPPASGDSVELGGGVRAEHRGRGIGRDLLAWQLAEATRLHDTLAPDTRWVVETYANGDIPATKRLFERFGLTPVRYFFEMGAPTAPVEPPALADGLRSVPVPADRLRDVHAAHVEVFQDHWGHQRRSFEEWAPLSVGSAVFRPALSRLALDGDEIVGYVLSYAEEDPTRLYIGQVGTKRPWRRRGVAAALLAEVLIAAGGAGMKHATLGVDADSPTGAVGLYERLGFVVDNRGTAYHLELPPR